MSIFQRSRRLRFDGIVKSPSMDFLQSHQFCVTFSGFPKNVAIYARLENLISPVKDMNTVLDLKSIQSHDKNQMHIGFLRNTIFTRDGYAYGKYKGLPRAAAPAQHELSLSQIRTIFSTTSEGFLPRTRIMGSLPTSPRS